MASIVLAVVSTVAYALGAVQQRRAAIAETRLVRQLLRPAWWLAIGLLCVGAGLHVAALRFGPLSVVQPLGALSLVFAAPLGARAERRTLTQQEWLGIGAAVFGLAALLALTRPAGTAHSLDGSTTSVISGVTLGLLGAMYLASRTAGRADGIWLALAAGIASAVSSSLTQSVLGAGRWGQAVPALGAVAVFGTLGTLLSQLAYRRSLSAPLATATIANPVAATVFGVAVFGEQATSGTAATALGLVAAAVAGVGVVLLTRSSAVVKQSRPAP